MKTIDIKCKGLFALPYDQIGSIQGNLKELTKENYERLRNEIRDTGFAFPVNVTKHPKLGWVTQDGWHRVLVVKTMVEKEGYECPPLPCTEIEWESEEMAGRRILQGSSQFAHTTGEGLYEFMENYKFDFDLAETKFDIPHIDFEEFKEEFGEEPEFQSGEDEVPEVKVETDIKLGDMFQLGEHRLLCGDSTDKAQVDRLMGGEKADITFTSPPYNAGCFGYDDGKDKYKGKSDNKSQDDYFNFLISFVDICLEQTKYTFFNNQFLSGNRHALGKFFGHYSLNIKEVFPWIKNTAPPNVNKGVFTNRFEFFLCLEKNNSIKGFPVEWQGKYHNVIEGHTAAKENMTNGAHSATMPIYVPEWFVERLPFIKSIYEPFGGSGSTLIACEKTKRKCFIMELDPQYVQVIVDRYEKFTGKKAKKI